MSSRFAQPFDSARVLDPSEGSPYAGAGLGSREIAADFLLCGHPQSECEANSLRAVLAATLARELRGDLFAASRDREEAPADRAIRQAALAAAEQAVLLLDVVTVYADQYGIGRDWRRQVGGEHDGNPIDAGPPAALQPAESSALRHVWTKLNGMAEDVTRLVREEAGLLARATARSRGATEGRDEGSTDDEAEARGRA